MDVDEVQSWSSSKLADWRAYFALQHEDRERPDDDGESATEKMRRDGAHMREKYRDAE